MRTAPVYGAWEKEWEGGEMVLQYVLCLWLLQQMGAPHWCEVICLIAVVCSALSVAVDLVKGLANLK